MRPQRSPRILLAIVVIVSSITRYEATRILLDDQERGGQIWKRNVHMLLLPSLQWRSVSPPSPNPATNKRPDGGVTPSMVGKINFAGKKTIAPPPPPSPSKVEGYEIKA